MADDTDTTAALTEAMSAPKSAKADGQEVQQHSLPDQIAMDKHLAAKRMAKAGGLGVKFRKIAHGGAV